MRFKIRHFIRMTFDGKGFVAVLQCGDKECQTANMVIEIRRMLGRAKQQEFPAGIDVIEKHDFGLSL